MSFTSAGTIGSVQGATGGTSSTITTGTTANAGNIIIVGCSIDNITTVTGASNNITGIIDSASNTYQKIGEYTHSSGGVANDGITVALFACLVDVTLLAGNSIITSYSGSATQRLVYTWRYTKTGSTFLQVGATQQGSAAASSNPGSLSVTPSDTADFLGIRWCGIEANQSLTVTASWTTFTGLGTGGGSGTSLRGEFRAYNTGAIITSAPTLSSTPDSASVMAVFRDSAVPTGGINITGMMGMF